MEKSDALIVLGFLGFAAYNWHEGDVVLTAACAIGFAATFSLFVWINRKMK